MRLFLLFITLLFAAPTWAQDAGDLTPAQQLEETFDQVDGLANVTARIRSDVVTLSGTVPSEQKALRAIEIAGEKTGAIEINDNIIRTAGLTENLTPVIEDARDDAMSFVRSLPLFLVALLVLAVFWVLGGFLSRRQRIWQRLSPNAFLAKILAQTVRVVVFLAGVVVALNIIGAQNFIAAVLGGAGVLGLAIGFAIRDPLENYFASIMLSLRQPFRKGDDVNIDGHEGKVIRLTSRATILMTADGHHLRVPNATVFKAVILNSSTNPEARVTFQLPTRDGADPVLSIAAGVEALLGTQGVVSSPEPSGLIVDAAGEGATLEFAAWVDQTEADPQKVRSLAIRTVERALEDPQPVADVSVDPPVMDVQPDVVIAGKVEEDDAANDGNLLDENRPTE